MKICSNPNCHLAGIPQPLDAFHKRADRPSGYQSQCKDCMRKSTLRYIHTERGKQKRKEYSQTEQGRKLRSDAVKRYHRTAKGKAYQRQQYYANLEKIKARSAVMIAIKQGKLAHVSTLCCVRCGTKATHYHHFQGYSPEHWLDVIPVCPRCHKALEKGNDIIT